MEKTPESRQFLAVDEVGCAEANRKNAPERLRTGGDARQGSRTRGRHGTLCEVGDTRSHSLQFRAESEVGVGPFSFHEMA